MREDSPPPDQSRGPDTLHVLIVSADESLSEECRAALSGVPDLRGIFYQAESFADALDIVRDRQPQFVIVDIEREIRELTEFSLEVHAVAPWASVVGTFQPHRFSHGELEPAVIIELLRAQVRDFLRRPLSPIELRDVLTRLFTSPEGRIAAPNGRVIAFISNKGGVGKSTLSVNVACGLAKRHPGRVLLIDTSLQLGICAMMLDLQPAATIVDAARERERLDETLLRGLTVPHESGLRLLAGPGDALEASDVTDEALARILNLARRAFDFVIVDTFPMLDSVVMAVLDLSDLVFLVFQGTTPCVAGTARLLPVLEGLGFSPSRQRTVLNRNHKRFLGELSSADMEAQLGRPLDYVVPYNKGVLVSMNTGRPLILGATSWWGFGRAITQIVAGIDGLNGAAGRDAGATPAVRAHLENERRRLATDRRMRNLGRPEGDRRSARDRRVMNVAELFDQELTR